MEDASERLNLSTDENQSGLVAPDTWSAEDGLQNSSEMLAATSRVPTLPFVEEMGNLRLVVYFN